MSYQPLVCNHCNHANQIISKQQKTGSIFQIRLFDSRRANPEILNKISFGSQAVSMQES